MGGREPWPRLSLVARGDKHARRNKCRKLSAQERDAIEARLRSEGRLAPAVNAPRGNNDAKLA